jgi:HEPN domain-containing protein
MPLDPALVSEARAWFTKAAEDLRAAEFEFRADPPLAFDIVFHAQQAAEKAMKGFLTWHRRTFRKTHNLIEIGEACAAITPALEPLLRRAAPLTEYAWRFRYPGEPEAPERAEAEAALSLAREVYEALLAKLPVKLLPTSM